MHLLASLISFAACAFLLSGHVLPDALGTRKKGLYFPPSLDTLLAWSTLFRSGGTWANYAGYVRTACIIVNASTQARCLCHLGPAQARLVCQVFDSPALKRARDSVAKAQNFVKRPRLFIQRWFMWHFAHASLGALLRHRAQVERMLQWCTLHVEYAKFGALFLLTYAFLLRLPSEALPVKAGRRGHGNRLFVEGDSIVLVLARRCGRFLWSLTPRIASVFAGRINQRAAAWCGAVGARNLRCLLRRGLRCRHIVASVRR